MESISDYKIPLSELLSILKTSGYEVSVERILEIQSVLLSTPVSKLSLSELKFIITPVLARNEEDQKNIHKIIDSYISGKIQHTEKKVSGFKTWFENRRLIFVFKVAGFIIIVLTAFLLYFLQKKEIKKNPSLNHPQQPLPADTSAIAANTKHINDSARLKPKSKVNPPPATSTVEYNRKAIIPTRLNIILQVAGAFGLGLGAILYYFIFFEKKNRMEAKKKTKQEEEESFTAGKEKKDNATEQPAHGILQFPEKGFLIQKTKEFSIIRANLKKMALAEKANVDVKKAVIATTKNAGFSTLAFDNQWKEKKYIIVADNREPDAHINHLLNFVIDFFAGSKISLNKYTYTADIRILNDRSKKVIKLEDLPYDFPGHHLIITGDCHTFFNKDTLLLPKEFDTLFQGWASKSIITPLPLQDWSYPEVQLQNSFFSVVPAEISAIELLSKAIADESLVKTTVLANRVRDKYSVSKYNFDTVNGVRDYLNNEELFQVICSLAVYPRLHWDITLALFAAIVKRTSKTSPAITLNYDALLKISRIPWLYTGQLDQSIRLQLFNFLEPETEIIARQTILELLHEINTLVPPASPGLRELRVQMKVNSFFLYAHDQQRYKQYADIKNEFISDWNNLEEWALKERVKTNLMPVDSEGEHKTVEEFVLQEERFEKRNVTFLRIVLLTLPAAILYILLSILRPSFVYVDSYEKVSFLAIINKDSVCKKEITAVVVNKPDKFDTTALKKYGGVNYIQIDNVEYNRTLSLSFLFADGTSAELSIDARDSAAAVSVECP